MIPKPSRKPPQFFFGTETDREIARVAEIDSKIAAGHKPLVTAYVRVDVGRASFETVVYTFGEEITATLLFNRMIEAYGIKGLDFFLKRAEQREQHWTHVCIKIGNEEEFCVHIGKAKPKAGESHLDLFLGAIQTTLELRDKAKAKKDKNEPQV